MDFAEHRPGAVVKTMDGSLTLSHEEHGECYHNLAGAETEARELNVKASGLDEALAAGPQRVLDVGLGLGYNALVTADAWLAASYPADLTVTSLEIDERLVEAIASGEAPWQANWSAERLAHCRSLRRDGATFQTTLPHPLHGAHLTWIIHVLDARVSRVPSTKGGYSFVWQDPFSPEKNPGMWDAVWFTKLRAAVAPGAVLMTYSVARAVRDALSASGWTPERIPSRLPPKRHWLKAT